ncbi:PucR family transcriptional regulator [Streptomyces tsukubensis]|uniref:Regulator n=1 Tax=Streptomyces tsukubensis TaxID=83656 RepID=A0A1V4A762_9ACTN|nr:helix-turn-helix domain-containing protein [Streptomyces tsukubensis]OON77273.1 regulator [Streptomyces tsukubensis]QFR92346.1 PucR family transcriptional regulator [Streptomyces tsukubensis]
MQPREIPDSYAEGYPDTLAEVARTGRRLTREELASRRQLGEQAAEAGYGLRSLVNGLLTATRANWPVPADSSAAQVLAAVEQAIDASAEGYERAQRLAVRHEEAARREFVDDLLHGRSDPGRLAERAGRFGLRLAHAHVVAVARGPEPYDDSHPVTRTVESAVFARFGDRRALLTTKSDLLICVVPAGQEEIARYFAKQAYAAADGSRAAIGRPHAGPGGVVLSYEEAVDALGLADRMGFDGPVLSAADLLVFPVLIRDRQAMSDLVLSTLGPLREARGGAGPLLETLSVYFDTGCVAARTARRLNLSVRALTYRLERIHQLTGADVNDAMSRYALQTAVIGARLFDWPAKDI